MDAALGFARSLYRVLLTHVPSQLGWGRCLVFVSGVNDHMGDPDALDGKGVAYFVCWCVQRPRRIVLARSRALGPWAFTGESPRGGLLELPKTVDAFCHHYALALEVAKSGQDKVAVHLVQYVENLETTGTALVVGTRLTIRAEPLAAKVRKIGVGSKSAAEKLSPLLGALSRIGAKAKGPKAMSDASTASETEGEEPASDDGESIASLASSIDVADAMAPASASGSADPEPLVPLAAPPGPPPDAEPKGAKASAFAKRLGIMAIQLAPSARSKCRQCSVNIAKGELRAEWSWHKQKPSGFVHLQCVDEEALPPGADRDASLGVVLAAQISEKDFGVQVELVWKSLRVGHQ